MKLYIDQNVFVTRLTITKRGQNDSFQTKQVGLQQCLLLSTASTQKLYILEKNY